MIGKNVIINQPCAMNTPAFYFDTIKNKRVLKESKYEVEIKDDCYIGPHCNFDRGVFRHTVVGKGTIIDSHVHISHDCIIGEHCEIDVGVILLGAVTIGDYSRICTGAVVHQKVKVGVGCVVGANSYLRHDLEDGHIAYGTPAKIVEKSHYDTVRKKPWAV